MKAITIRGIDEEIDSRLRKKAEENGDSINTTILKLLRKALQLDKENPYPEYHDLDNLAGTWSDHTTLIEAVPRRYNVPRNQTQLLVAENIEGPYKPLVQEYDFCLGPEDWDIIDGTLYEEDGVIYHVFVHEWTQIIDGTMDYFPLSEDLTHRTSEPILI